MQILDADYRLLVQNAEATVGPQPPPWYVPVGKPKAKEIEVEAKEQKELHALRVLAQAWMEMRLGMEVTAIYESDAQWVNLKEIEPQASPLLRIMYDTIINFIAGQTLQFRSLAQGLVNRDERAGIEDHLADALRAVKEQTFREGQGSLPRVLTADALMGMVALYHAPDPGERRTGQRVYRVDPKVVYPIFGRDGLDRVYTVYDARYSEVARDFGDGPGGAATRRIQEIARKGAGRGSRAIDLETAYELIGYWDREWGIVLWKGQVIREWSHKLWMVPWIVGVPNWRQRAGTKSANAFAWGGDRSGARIDPLGISTGPGSSLAASTRQQDLARTYEPFLTPWLATVDKLEKMLTRTNYATDVALDPALVWKRASSNSTEGVPLVQRYRSGVTEIQEDEELDTLPITPLNESFEPWLKLFTMEVQAAIPIPILQGQTIGTQASGNAIDVINEMGYSHFAPVVEFMPMVWQEWAHRTLLYKRDWAPTYDPANPQGGFPAPARYKRAPVRLTREMLERVGCYVECVMSRFSLGGMAAAATTAAILNEQLHLGTRRYWLESFGMTTNPQQLDDDRMDQDLEDAPGYVEGRSINHLYDQLEQAAEMGDEKSLRQLTALAKRVSAKQAMHDIQIAKMAGMMAGQPEPLPGELPAAAGGANVMPYLSAPEVGRSTGAEGGAPALAPPLPGQG